MIKARSKKVSLLLVLMMLATLFVGVGTASAATDNVALTVPSVGTSGDNVKLGTVRVTETDASTGTFASGDQITVNLPTGVKYMAIATSTSLDDYAKIAGANGASNGQSLSLVTATKKTLTVEINGNLKDEGIKNHIDFHFDTEDSSKVSLDGPDADIAVEVYSNGSAVTPGKVVNATSASAGTTSTVLDDSTISNSSGAQELGTIRIAENQVGALEASKDDEIKIIAPSDVTIVAPKDYKGTEVDKQSVVTPVGWEFDSTNSGVKDNEDGYSQLTLRVSKSSTNIPAFVNVKLFVKVTDSDLTGPLQFTIKGDNVTTQKLTIGSVGDYDISVAAKGDPKTVKAGAANQEIQDLTVKELLKGSLLENRDLTLELPDYAHWYQAPDIKVETGDGDFNDPDSKNQTEDNQRHKLSFTVNKTSTSKTEFTFEDMKIFLDADAPAGDLTVKVSGDAIGDEHDVVLAKVVTPVTVTATPTNVKLGVSAQAAGDLTITEAEAGMLKYQVTDIIANDASKNFTPTDSNSAKTSTTTQTISTNDASKLLVGLPDGVTFDSTPTVEVTTGDLKIKEGSVKLTNDDQYLEIPIDKTSTVASTITVSNIKLTLDRTVPEGAINAKIFGNAVDQVADTTTSGDYAYKDAVTKTAIATAVTPADPNASYTSTFVIGASTYTINGETVDAVAPSYIKNSRTYLAVRDVAHALGIPDTNVLWDQTNYTVTLIKGDKVVQMKIGSNVLSVNGAAITMDVAPEITADRTFLPAAWLAQAFGYGATFDAATQTVTIK